MTPRLSLVALTLLASACDRGVTPPLNLGTVKTISQADAGKLVDATVTAWTSGDAARIKALYAPEVIGFDYAVGPLTTDRAAWDKAQDAYAAQAFDSASQKQRAIQVLSPTVFVASGVWDVKSSTTPANDSTVRCTDVYQKDATGAWPIVNEHCSPLPQAS